jgi:hypothetical protein
MLSAIERPIGESASGYIPTKRQARDPRFSTALTVDIKPGQVGKEANKMALKTNAQGQPALLMKTVNLRENMSLQERLEQELAKFKDNPYEFIDPRNKPAHDNKFGMNGHVDENFADGKVKGKSRPGRVKRAGASCDGSVSSLRQKAKNTGGERAKMYHWCANMKSGRQDESQQSGDLRTFHARIKLQSGGTLIDTQVVARNYEMAKRLLRAQYGNASIVSNVREVK